MPSGSIAKSSPHQEVSNIIENTSNELSEEIETKQNKLTGTAGQVVGFDAIGNAVAQAVNFGGDGFVQFITESCEWTAPFDMEATIMCVGAGGGGGGGGSGTSGSEPNRGNIGGGGGAGYIATKTVTLEAGTLVAITISEGGGGGPGGVQPSGATAGKSGTKGETGGTTSFGVYISAPGGGGGGAGTTTGIAYSAKVGNGPLIDYIYDSSLHGNGRGMPSLPFALGGEPGIKGSEVGESGTNGTSGSLGSGGGGGGGGATGTTNKNGTAGPGGNGAKGGDGLVLLICRPIIAEES